MEYVIKIKMDNAAFEDRDQELSRILTKLSDRILSEGSDNTITIMDVNGNRVGIAGIITRR